MKRKPFVIGIAGGTGSGKTTVAKKIRAHFKNKVLYIPHDNYYRDQTQLTLEERKKTNYDHPNSLETNLLIRHLKKLIAGEKVAMPLYDFVVHNRRDQPITVLSKPIIVVEGILIFENQELRNIFDLKLYVDTDADIRLSRKITRDIGERGRTLEFVLHQYLAMARPMHLAFGEPSKKYADLIIPEGGDNHIAVRSIIHAVDRLRKEKY
ncbi:uridine kinase [Patescibacteria group bacterium]|nr:uridine kinase [Patescibacteria group bacterium]MCL5092007.1 uridine kinase [Patescibacteria group bacterium]